MRFLAGHLKRMESVVQPTPYLLKLVDKGFLFDYAFSGERLNMKWFLKLVSNVVIVTLMIILGFSFFAIIQNKQNPNQIPDFFGYTPLSVLSGSMSPVMEPGDMIVTRRVEPGEIKVGDVITYQVDKQTLVTHRVIEVIEGGGELAFRTKGDANNTEDSGSIKADRLVGIFVFNIPYGGYIANFARSTHGFLLFVLLPATLLIASLMKDLLSELGRKKEAESPEDSMKA